MSASLAAQTLDLVRTVARGAEAAVTVRRQTVALTRFAESFIHQNVAEESVQVALTVHVDGRTATSSATVADAAGLTALVDSALAGAALRPVDATWPGLAPPAGPGSAGNWDADTADAPPEARARVVADFVAATAGLSGAGYCQTSGVEAWFLNTAGQSLSGRVSGAAVNAVARTGRSDGVARAASVGLRDIDGHALGVAAAAKARAGTEQVDLDPGRYEVVLEAGAVADIVSGLFTYALNGKAVVEGRSCARLGVAQFDPALTLSEDSTDARAGALPFDGEGTPRRPLTFVDAGRTTAVAHDRRTAAACAASSTGGSIPGAERWGAFPSDVRLAAGSGADLVAGVERGLLVSDFWYTRALDPRTVVFTGLTRNGVWLIEDGRLGPAVGTLRFTQSYVDALAPGAVLGVGVQQHSFPGGVSFAADGGSLYVPHLRLASWNITGGARG